MNPIPQPNRMAQAYQTAATILGNPVTFTWDNNNGATIQGTINNGLFRPNGGNANYSTPGSMVVANGHTQGGNSRSAQTTISFNTFDVGYAQLDKDFERWILNNVVPSWLNTCNNLILARNNAVTRENNLILARNIAQTAHNNSLKIAFSERDAALASRANTISALIAVQTQATVSVRTANADRDNALDARNRAQKAEREVTEKLRVLTDKLENVTAFSRSLLTPMQEANVPADQEPDNEDASSEDESDQEPVSDKEDKDVPPLEEIQ